MATLSRDPVRVVVSTVETEADGRELGRRLVDEGLAACVSVVPVASSIYRWKGKVEEGAEVLLWMKTTPDKAAELRRRLAEIHPYDLPEILVLDARASVGYRAWMLDALAGRA